MALRKLRQKTFAEMLKELDPDADFQESSSPSTVASLAFPTWKEEVAAKKFKAQTQAATKSSKKPQNSQATSSANKFPPSFKKPNQVPHTTQPQQQDLNEITISLVDSLKDIMKDLNTPDVFQEMILRCCTPYIDKIINQITDSISKKFNELFGV